MMLPVDNSRLMDLGFGILSDRPIDDFFTEVIARKSKNRHKHRMQPTDVQYRPVAKTDQFFCNSFRKRRMTLSVLTG